MSYARVTTIAHRTSVVKDALELKLREETALRAAAENKLIQAEARIAKLEARQAKTERKERAHLAAMGLMKDKADRTLKTWREADSIRVDEIHELLDQLLEECQPSVRKEDFSVIPTELHLLEGLLSPAETKKVLEAIATIGEIFPEGYPEECQMVQAYKKPRRSKD